MKKVIANALVSVYHKDGLEPLLRQMNDLGISLLSTGGTADFIDSLGLPVQRVESLTGYPSILGGRVKTLHPKVFGGILARRDDPDNAQMAEFDIPHIDLVIVDLYPFEKTVAESDKEAEIIEKIDIGGISLIRAAAKNYQHVVIVPDQEAYGLLADELNAQGPATTLEFRKHMAARAFHISSHYDSAIFSYFNRFAQSYVLKLSMSRSEPLRYGENPHQSARFAGALDELFDLLHGKQLSYNNLLDVDAAVHLMADFLHEGPSVAILKHNNACGLASRSTLAEAWDAALAGDPVSAFGGVIISNTAIDLATAEKINTLFYEVLIAPDFDEAALNLLREKKSRILMRIRHWNLPGTQLRSLLNGYIMQDKDSFVLTQDELRQVTLASADSHTLQDLVYASKCVKHLKSNAIALVKNRQLVGMGCGQTSRVDALKQAIHKAHSFQLPLQGAAMASEAFFPFPDCVEIASECGIMAVVQPGGSVKDQESIDYCNEHGMSMYLTGHRHFKH
jgi:phosphoribosylaminoimidazolecarboxamide formyltransferase / IMP cyclohydrolase